MQRKVKTLLLVTAGATAWASPAFAQSTDASAPATTSDQSVPPIAPAPLAEAPPAETSSSDIVVTARRQNESLMNVPVVVSVQTAETLARYNADSLTAIGDLTPSVIVASYSDQGGGSIAIRGISSPANQIGFEQAVSVALDGVQASSGRVATYGFFDLQQVEVLKGPQALFFGKNSTAGVISIATKGPTDKFEASLQGSYEAVGDEYMVSGTVSGPLTDTLGIRVALRYRNLDGWLRNTAQPLANPFYSAASGEPASISALPGTRNPRPGEEEILGRVTLVFKPTNNFKATLKLFHAYSEDAGTGVGTQNIGPCVGPNPRVNGIADPSGDCRIDNRTTIGDTTPAIASTFKLVPTDGTGHGELNVTLASLAMEASLGKVSLASITGFSQTSYKAFSGFDQTSYSELAAGETPFERDYSQEVRLTSDFSAPINFMVGGYFQDSRITYGNESKLNDTTYYNPVANRYVPWQSLAIQTGTAVSLFGQLRWKVTDKLELAGGARWTKERKNYRKQNLYSFGAYYTATTIYPGSDEVGVLKGRFSDSNVSPEVTLTWRPENNLTVFGAYRTGFKSGGFGLGNPLSPSTRIAAVDYDSETAQGGELGVRGRFARNAGSFSAAFFRYDFSNLQVNVYDPTLVSYVINNAGKVKQTGFELEGDYSITNQFKIHGALAYVDNKFENYIGQCYSYAFPTGTVRATAVPPPNCSFVNATSLTLQQVYDGRTPARSPKFSGNAGFVYKVPLGGLSGELTGDANYSSSYYAADTLVAASRQPAFWRFNASGSVMSADNRWKFSLIGRNLTNKYVLLYAVDRTGGAGVPGMIGEQRGVVDRGREVMFQVSLNF